MELELQKTINLQTHKEQIIAYVEHEWEWTVYGSVYKASPPRLPRYDHHNHQVFNSSITKLELAQNQL